MVLGTGLKVIPDTTKIPNLDRGVKGVIGRVRIRHQVGEIEILKSNGMHLLRHPLLPGPDQSLLRDRLVVKTTAIIEANLHAPFDHLEVTQVRAVNMFITARGIYVQIPMSKVHQNKEEFGHGDEGMMTIVSIDEMETYACALRLLLLLGPAHHHIKMIVNVLN